MAKFGHLANTGMVLSGISTLPRTLTLVLASVVTETWSACGILVKCGVFLLLRLVNFVFNLILFFSFISRPTKDIAAVSLSKLALPSKVDASCMAWDLNAEMLR